MERRVAGWEAAHEIDEEKMTVVLGLTKKEFEAREEKREIDGVSEKMGELTVEEEKVEGKGKGEMEEEK